MTTIVLDPALAAAVLDNAAGRYSAACRIGLLGLGNVGSAFARHTREAASHLSVRGFAPIVATALVRTTAHPRAASAFVTSITSDVDAFFAEPVDVIVEVLGGVEPAYTLVRRALDRGIPVVTGNKSLIAACGEELTQLARRRGTALRYEASCIAGVPFLGAFERRPLASRASGVTAILNGTSNSILTAMTSGATFDAALAETERRGFAEPDPSMDISGADAAEKLAILVRVFGRLIVDPASLPLESLASIDPADIAAAAAFDGAIKPVAQASWHGRAVQAFVGPAFVAGAHPLARVSGVTNGIVIAPVRARPESGGQPRPAPGAVCFTGPGAGPDVTACTLLDDVAELMAERRVRTPAPEMSQVAASITRPDSPWFVRLQDAAGPSTRLWADPSTGLRAGPSIGLKAGPSTGLGASESEVADLLGSYGIWSTRLARRGDRIYVLVCPAGCGQVRSALDALQAATGAAAAAFPVVSAAAEDAGC